MSEYNRTTLEYLLEDHTEDELDSYPHPAQILSIRGAIGSLLGEDLQEVGDARDDVAGKLSIHPDDPQSIADHVALSTVDLFLGRDPAPSARAALDALTASGAPETGLPGGLPVIVGLAAAALAGTDDDRASWAAAALVAQHRPGRAEDEAEQLLLTSDISDPSIRLYSALRGSLAALDQITSDEGPLFAALLAGVDRELPGTWFGALDGYDECTRAPHANGGIYPRLRWSIDRVDAAKVADGRQAHVFVDITGAGRLFGHVESAKPLLASLLPSLEAGLSKRAIQQLSSVKVTIQPDREIEVESRDLSSLHGRFEIALARVAALLERPLGSDGVVLS